MLCEFHLDLKIKEPNFKCSHQKKINCNYVRRCMLTYCGNPFVIYTCIELCWTPKSNTMLYVKYVSIWKLRRIIEKWTPGWNLWCSIVASASFFFVSIFVYENTLIKGFELEKQKKPSAALGTRYTQEPLFPHRSPHVICLWPTSAQIPPNSQDGSGNHPGALDD